MNISKFIEELKRRNVFKVAAAYAIAGWLIIQIATSVFPAFEFPNWTTQFVIILVGIGFPLSMIFAWAFELTPEGLKKSKEVDITESVTDRTGKKLNGIIISVMAVAIFFLLTERIFFAESSILDRNMALVNEASIAVLPFADLSPNGDQEYFSDGLSEELLNVLAKVEDMKVAGRTSSFKFKGQNENLKLIGAELDVDHILEGSVRKAGNTIRITAQLIKVDDGFHVWSETYDREYTAENIFRIQDEISQKVLNELKIRLLNNEEELVELETIPTEDVEAYEAYLRGTELLRDRNPDEIQLAIEQFETATKLDPSFAEAYAYLSFSYARLYEYGNINKEEVLDYLRSYSDQALFINPNIPRAYAGLSAYYEIIEDTLNSISAIKRAYELNPKDAEMVNSYAVLLGVYEEIDDDYEDRSDSLYQIAYTLDPLNPVIASNMGRLYRREKNFEKAIETFDKIIETNPEFLSAYTQKIYILRSEGFGLRDEDFMAAYNGYQENPESLDFIEVLQQSARYFELDSLEMFLTKEVIRLYPNNPMAENAQRILKFQKFNTHLDNKEFEEARVFARENLMEEIGDNIEIFREFLENAESVALFDDYFENREFQKATEILREIRPEFFSDTLTTHPQGNFQTARVKYIFEQIGREDLVKNLDKLEFEYGDWVEFEYDQDISKEEPNIVRVLANESLYNNDSKRYREIVEELYFTRKYKFFKWNEMLDQPHELELLKDPELKELIDRIEADQKRMKDNVVAFLKEEGAWKDSWEESEE